MIEFRFKDGHCEISEDGVEISYRNRLAIFVDIVRRNPVVGSAMLVPSALGIYVIFGTNIPGREILGVTLILMNFSLPVIYDKWLEFRGRYPKPEKIGMEEIDSVAVRRVRKATNGLYSDDDHPAITFYFARDGEENTGTVLFHHIFELTEEEQMEIDRLFDESAEFFREQNVEVHEIYGSEA